LRDKLKSASLDSAKTPANSVDMLLFLCHSQRRSLHIKPYRAFPAIVHRQRWQRLLHRWRSHHIVRESSAN
jgi:hypothetical protein